MNHLLKTIIPTFAIFLAVFLLTSASGKAQNTEGKARYLITYDWVKMRKSYDYLSKEQNERIDYVWGNDSEWKIYGNLYFSDSLSKFEDSEEKADPEDEGGYDWRKDEYLIWRDLKRNRITDNIKILGKIYVIEDSLIYPDWKILNDIKDVAGHICMNASWYDTLNKQKIIAWFALDIPLSAGPERLGGLPGLILEVNVNNGAKIATVDKIELKALTNELDLPKKIRGKKVSEAQYEDVLRQYYKDCRKAERPPWGIRY